MLSLLRAPLDLWHRRYARPNPDALAAVQGLTPAVVVTGASEGIGRALARRFAEEGHAVVLVARRREALEAAASYIRAATSNTRATVVRSAPASRADEAQATAAEPAPAKHGDELAATATEPSLDGTPARAGVQPISPAILILPLDITTPDALQQLDAFLAANRLYLSVLVNSAGIGLSGEFDSHAPEEVMRLVELNVTALTRLMRHVLPGMRDRAEGGILNVSSLGGFCPGPYQAAYYASKAYVISLTEAAASEMSGRGVRLTVLAPGPVETTFHARMDADNSLYRWLIPALSADAVARAGWRGFMLWRRVVVPGLIPLGLSLAVRLLPRFIVVPLVGWLLAPRGDAKKLV